MNTRLIKAYKLLSQCEPNSQPHTYIIHSGGKRYTATTRLHEAGRGCGCEDNQWHGPECKHVLAAELHEVLDISNTIIQDSKYRSFASNVQMYLWNVRDAIWKPEAAPLGNHTLRWLREVGKDWPSYERRLKTIATLLEGKFVEPEPLTAERAEAELFDL